MAEAMIGEIRAFPYLYAPYGWFDCDGSKYMISQYTALYAIIGPTYGGDQRTYFNVPNLQGAVALGQGQGPGLSYYQLGRAAGTEGVALTSTAQLPVHNHTLQVQNLPLGQEPADFTAAPKPGLSYGSRYWYNLAQRPAVSYLAYNPAPPASGTTAPVAPTPMALTALDPYGGGSQPHENRQPFVPLRYCICWDGIYMPNPN